MAGRGVVYTSDGVGTENEEDRDAANDDYFAFQTPPTRSFMKLVPRASKTQGGKLESKRSSGNKPSRSSSGKGLGPPQALHRQAHNASAARRQAKDRRQKARSQARFFKEIDTTLEALGIGTAGAAASAGGSLGGAASGMPPSPCSSSVNLSLSLAPSADQLLTPTASSSRAGTPPPQAVPTGLGGISRRATSEQRLAEHLPSGYSTPDRYVSMGGPPLVSFGRGSTNGTLLPAEPSGLPPRMPGVTAERHHPALSMQLPAGHGQAEHGNGPAAHRRAVSVEGEPGAGAPNPYAGFMLQAAAAGEGGPAGPFHPTPSRGAFILPPGIGTAVIANRDEFRRHIGHVIMGHAQSEEDLEEAVSQVEERAEPLHDEIEALHEAAEHAADGGVVSCTSLDTMNNSLEDLFRRTKEVLRRAKPLRSRLADHVELLPRLNELLVKLLAGLVEAAEAVSRAGEAVMAAAGELRDRGSEDDVRKSVKMVKRLLELTEFISRRAADELDAANEAAQAQPLTAACQAAAVSLCSACIQAAAQAAPVLLKPDSLSSESFVHEKDNQAKRLCVLWDEASRLTEKLAKRYPGFRLRLYGELAAALLEAGDLALTMMQAAAAAGQGPDGEAPGDVSDAASDSGTESDTSRAVQAGNAWGGRMSSAWGGRRGPAGRGGTTDKEIEAQAWVPSLLQMLLNRAGETHRGLRDALAEALRYRAVAEGSLDLDDVDDLGSAGLGPGMGSGASGSAGGQAAASAAALEEALALDGSDLEELFTALDRLQEVFAELCVANLKRTMRLCSGSTGEPLSVWALESARDAAEAALRFVYIHDNSSMALGDMLGQEVTEEHKAWLHHTWQEYTRLSQGVVNGLLSIRRQINVRKGNMSPPPASAQRPTPAAAPLAVAGAGRARPAGPTATARLALSGVPAGASGRGPHEQAGGRAPGAAATALAAALGAGPTAGLGRRRPPPAPKLSLAPPAAGVGSGTSRLQPFSPAASVSGLPWGQAAYSPHAVPQQQFGSIAAAAGGTAPDWAAGSSSSAALVAAELGAAAVAAAAAAAASSSVSVSAGSAAPAAPPMWKAALLAPAAEAARGHGSTRSSFESGELSPSDRSRRHQAQPAAAAAAAAAAAEGRPAGSATQRLAAPSTVAATASSFAPTAKRRDQQPNQQSRPATDRGTAGSGRGAARGGLSARGGGNGGRGSGRLFGRGRGRLARGDDESGYAEDDQLPANGTEQHGTEQSAHSRDRREGAATDVHEQEGAGAASTSTRARPLPSPMATAAVSEQHTVAAASVTATNLSDAVSPSTASSWAAVAARAGQGSAAASGSVRLPSANTMRSPFALSSAASRAASGVVPTAAPAPATASPFAAIAMQPPPASPAASASPANSHAPSPQHTPHQSAPPSPPSRSTVSSAPDAGVALVTSPSLTTGGLPQVPQAPALQPPPASSASTQATIAGAHGYSGGSSTTITTTTAATSASSAFQFAPVSAAAMTSSSGQPRANGATAAGANSSSGSSGKRTPKLGSPHASGPVVPPPAACGVSSAAVLAADARGPGAAGMAIADAAGTAEGVWTAVASGGAHHRQHQHQAHQQPQARGGHTARPGQGPGQVGAGPKAARTASLTAQVSLGPGGLGPAAPAVTDLARQGSEGLAGHVVRDPELAALLHAIACDPFWGIRWSDLSAGLSTLVGNGSTGQVFAGTYLHGEVAIKVIGINRDMEYDLGALRAFKAEVDLNKRLNNHPNIVRFIGVCADYIQYAARQAGLLTDADLIHTRWAAPPRALASRDGRPFAPMLAIVMEYCHLGTLWTMIGEARRLSNAVARGQQVGRTSSNRWGFIFWKSWERRMEVLCGAAAGLEYMHKNHVIHHDFTSYNLLLDERSGKWTTKVCDFNLSRVVSRHAGGAPASGGASSLTVPNSGNMYSPRWQSPEYLEGKEYATATDVFSFGVVLWEVVTLQTPWENELHQYENKGLKVLEPVFIHEEVVTKNKRLAFPDPAALEPELPELPQLVDLCERCWHKDPRSRPRMTEVADVLTTVLTSVRQREEAARRAAAAAARRPAGESAHGTAQQAAGGAAAAAASAAVAGAQSTAMQSAAVVPPSAATAVGVSPPVPALPGAPARGTNTPASPFARAVPSPFAASASTPPKPMPSPFKTDQ